MDDGMKDHAKVSKTVTRRQGVSRVRIPPPPLTRTKGLQKSPLPIEDGARKPEPDRPKSAQFPRECGHVAPRADRTPIAQTPPARIRSADRCLSPDVGAVPPSRLVSDPARYCVGDVAGERGE